MTEATKPRPVRLPPSRNLCVKHSCLFPYYAFCLAFAARKRSYREHVAFREESETFAQVLCDHVTGHSRFGLDVDRDVRHAVLFLKNDLKLVLDAGNLHQSLFHLTRIEIDALDDQHIVRTACDSVDTERGASAGTLLARKNARNVVRAITDNRHRLARNGGEHDLAVFAVRNGCSGHGIDNFGDVLVFPHVQTVMRLAVLSRRADAAGFGHSVDVEAFDMEALLDLAAHFVRKGLGTEYAYAQRRNIAISSSLGIQLLDKTRNVGNDAAETLRAEVAHELYLAFRIAGRGRHAEESGLAATVIATEASVEETKRRHDLERIALFEPRHREAARHALRPLVEVVLGVRHDDRRSGGAGRHVEFEEIASIHAIHFERIRLTEILLREERKLRKVVKRLKILGIREPALLKTVAIEIILPYATETLAQAFELHLRVFVTAHSLGRTIPKYILSFHGIEL